MTDIDLTAGPTTPRKAPKIESTDEAEATVSVEEDDQIHRLYGTKTPETANQLLVSALNALGQNGNKHFDLMTSMAVEMEPRNALEGMLISQITATHLAISEVSRGLRHASSAVLRESYERPMTRLSRTSSLRWRR